MDEMDEVDQMDGAGKSIWPAGRMPLMPLGPSISSSRSRPSSSSTAFCRPYFATTQPSGPFTKRAWVMSFLRPVRGTVMSTSTSQT